MPIKLNKINGGVVYAPAMNERTPGAMYPRVICLQHSNEHQGRLLACFEQYTYDTPVFSIMVSDDHGLTWSVLSRVEDTKNGWGMRYQPHLFELPQDTGKLKKGTILCAGNAIPDDFSQTELMLYKSEDDGRSWSYMSSVMKGGAADVDAEQGIERPVWEPFLYLSAAGDLVCYYSDERFQWDQGFNQLLSHQVSTDGGYTWGEEVFDVAIPGGKLRPDMPIIARLPNDRYIMVYEIVNVEYIPVYCRFSDDGLDWGDPAELGTVIKDEKGNFLSGTPYVIWLPQGGPQGTILVSARKPGVYDGLLEPSSYFLANYQCGEGPWHKVTGLVPYDSRCRGTGYSQTMIPLADPGKLLHLVPAQMGPQLTQIGYGIGEIIEYDNAD